ncbi:YceK/YidQ family lipoprotein [Pseudomonas sp. B2M1-30]|uniref:YceK/YidQ family lipoprotein n=1 Tax=Pseudomonas koreensis TaxID=198620 RepID=A0A9X2XJA5_9PSED|nr:MULTISPECIES: YceK/YidQ family lipoprotein [Pseudomonas]MCU0118306.1 YceK/YidQ family lipoprotein [Pseudomonas sp. B2M1-30]MCU7250135.1 YceK/YidQ family lipoprotein [Pseudomonas koreensis]MCU7259656.1 YceK/YidQ family lipoprotein [Pseudomonas koreensis]
MKGIFRLGSVAGVVLMLAGCGTMIGRVSQGMSDVDYYKSVDGGLQLLGVTGKESKPAAIMCYFMIICPLVTVVSLPVDAAVDTVLLPVDYVNTL